MNQFKRTVRSIFLNLTLTLTIVFILTIPSKAFCYYDRFDSEFIDLAKWQEKDHSVREIKNGKLQLNEYGTTWRSSTYLHLTTPVTGYLEAKITIQSGSLVLKGDGNGFARIGAYFYNSERGPGSYNEYEGNVWGDVRIVLENDGSLTAKATLWESTAPDQSAGPVILDQEFAKSIDFDTEYTVSMELSGSQLIFRCDDSEIVYQIQTPVYTPYNPYQHLCTRIYPEAGSAVSVKALFDDVSVEKGTLYDSFESPFIDSTNWEESDHTIREISNGKLRIGASGSTRRHSTHIHPIYPASKYMEAKTTIQNASQIIGNGRAYARIGAYFYNSERGPGSYNEYEGNVWGDVQIVLENDNSLTAKAKLWKSTAPDQSTGENILEQNFITPIGFETEYIVSIELSGSKMIYKCNGEEIIYQVATPLYDPFQPYQLLTSRIYPEEGGRASITALFDDVKLEKVVNNADILNVKAYIDGRSHLLIQDRNVWWHHYDFVAPGQYGETKPTIINYLIWYPNWIVEDTWFCDCDSSIYSALLPPLPTHGLAIHLSPILVRGEVSIIQQPSLDNLYTAIVEFNDNDQPGATWYEVDIHQIPPANLDCDHDLDIDGYDLYCRVKDITNPTLEEFSKWFGIIYIP